MPKTNKQSGYLVKIEAFVPADLKDVNALATLQKTVKAMQDLLPGGSGADIQTTRR